MDKTAEANLFTTTEELKDFIMWAKSQRLKSATIGQISFEFSELAHINDIESVPNVENVDVAAAPTSPKLPGGNTQTSEEDELLFWSAR